MAQGSTAATGMSRGSHRLMSSGSPGPQTAPVTAVVTSHQAALQGAQQRGAAPCHGSAR